MRPFFSLVIPCYNDGRYQEGEYLDRLLDNLCSQNLKKEELEVILADDHSPVPFNDIIEKYCDRLDLKYCLTDYNFAPGNTRQCGSRLATGRWLCFADHDDVLYPDALKVAKEAIEEHDPKYYVMSDFNKVDEHGDVIEEFRGSQLANWVHGKFYSLDNFWNRYSLSFPRDLKTHEDIALGVQVHCILDNLGTNNVLYLKIPTYMWTFNSTSVSHSQYTDNESNSFLEREFPDYLRSRWGQYIEAYKSGYLDTYQFIENSIKEIRTCWILINTWINCNHLEYIDRNEKEVHNYLLMFLMHANISLAYLKVILAKLYPKVIDQIDRTAEKYDKMKLFDWLHYIYRLENIDGE